MTQPLPRILLVDDEPNVIEGLTRRLRREYELHFAYDGIEALKVLERHGDMHVIVSDMRMPNMNGAQLLAQVCERHPDTVRILLTGQTDLNSAIAAVNEGQIFRFLVKPCPTEVLRLQLRAAMRQHKLINAERTLLDQTLRGAVQALCDVLALAMPEAFGKATRIRQRVRQLAEAVGLQDAWRVEVAATLSQVGAVTLSAETAAKLYRGQALTPDEQAAVDRLPTIAIDLLKPIPRLSAVCELIALGVGGERSQAPKALEAQVLRACNAFEALQTSGYSSADALASLQLAGYDPGLVSALGQLVSAENPADRVAAVSLLELREGMVLIEDVYSATGTLLLARGQRIQRNVIERLRAMGRVSARVNTCACGGRTDQS